MHIKPTPRRVKQGGFLAHCAYLSAAVIEAHGLYSIMAGVLLLFVIAGVIMHVEVAE